MKNLLFGLSFLLLATACSDTGGGAPGSPGNPSPAPLNGFAQQIQKSSFQCAMGSCPGYVAAIYRDSGNGVALTCTGTYIGDGRVLTNAHCLDGGQRRAGATCSNIAIQLPNFDGQPKETFGCQSVEDVSQNYGIEIQPDWAILNIAGSTARPPANISLAPIYANTSVNLWKINFDLFGNSPVASVSSVTCVANSSHSFSKRSAGPGTAISDLANCSVPLRKGNSGSGFFRNGALVGVFNFMYEWEQSFGGGTNLHCIPVRGRILPDSCAFANPEYGQLASVYSMLKEQKAHISYQQTQNALMQNYQAVGYREFRMAPTTLSALDRLQWSGAGSALDPVRALLIREVVLQAYPFLPTCVEPGSPAAFQQNIAARISRGRTVPGEVLFPERFSSVESTTVRFQQLQDGSGYMISFLSNVFPDDSYNTVLGNSPNFGFSIPYCQ